jgi:Flp pilus assembly pilin Flp
MMLRSFARLSMIMTALVTRAPNAQLRSRAHRRDSGATLVEYAFLVALIAIVCVAAVSLFGRSAGSNLSRSGSSLFTP